MRLQESIFVLKPKQYFGITVELETNLHMYVCIFLKGLGREN